MRESKSTTVLVLGVAVGVVVATLFLSHPRHVGAASNDRSGEYVMATGAVSINPRVQTDGVWMLDYRSGKLLATVIDKTAGKIVGWAEVDLTSEFQVKALQDVHFMMTTGYVTQGQSALYVAETTTGKFGVYTMGPGVNGQGIVIRRHDMTSFRNPEPAPAAPAPAAMAPAGPAPGAIVNPFTPAPPVPAPAAIPAPVPAPGLPGAIPQLPPAVPLEPKK
jgi:hypothetical protein